MNQQVWNISWPNNISCLSSEEGVPAVGIRKDFLEVNVLTSILKDKVETCNRLEKSISKELKGLSSRKLHREVWDLSLGSSGGWRTGVKEHTIERNVRVLSWDSMNGCLRTLDFILRMVENSWWVISLGTVMRGVGAEGTGTTLSLPGACCNHSDTIAKARNCWA